MRIVYETGQGEKLVSTLCDKLKDCIFAIYVCDYENFEYVSTNLKARLPKLLSIGTTGCFFTPTSGTGKGVSAMGFYEDEIEVYVGTLRKLDVYPIKYLPGFMWSVDVIHERYQNNVCVEFTTGCEERLVSTLKVGLEKVGMRLVGATAGNVPAGGEKKIACNGKILTNAAAFAVIGSKMGKIHLFKENIFHTRKKIHRVTGVSDDGRTITEIDHRRALTVYEEETGYSDVNVEEGIFNNPLCRVVGNEHYITAIGSFQKGDGSITLHKNVQKNDLIAITDVLEDYRGHVKGNLEKMKLGNNVKGIFSINGSLRYRFFEREEYIGEYAKAFYDTAGGCHLGMVGDGEQYLNQHINQSMICMIFTSDR